MFPKRKYTETKLFWTEFLPSNKVPMTSSVRYIPMYIPIGRYLGSNYKIVFIVQLRFEQPILCWIYTIKDLLRKGTLYFGKDDFIIRLLELKYEKSAFRKAGVLTSDRLFQRAVTTNRMLESLTLEQIHKEGFLRKCFHNLTLWIHSTKSNPFSES